ncbi:MAG: segregation/condensation protein A [Syntrophales bacterium]|nr:segregation/condensation protein A [Syntrophales bacterium]
MDYEVKLDIFEGPLDLLLYLIRKNEIDIYDIPIALITEQYLKYLEMLKALNLDLAGEYLLLASTLIHIKSRMLLPETAEGDEEEELDPRIELVQQLLEYQAYKEASLVLDKRPQLDRDVFKRGGVEPDVIHEGSDEGEALTEVSLFDLVEAFQRVISKMAPSQLMDIEVDKISLERRINDVKALLRQHGSMTFLELLSGQNGRRQLIYTFLAILELIKGGMIRAYQSEPFGVIRLLFEGDDG